MGQTIAEALFAEGMAKGEAKARSMADTLFAEAVARGRLEGSREILQSLLQHKFKTLPDNLLEHIAAASDHQRLRACIYAVFDMNSLDELDL